MNPKIKDENVFMKENEALPGDLAVCLVGHGTRDKFGINEFLTLSAKFKELEPDRIIECGFLEFAKPTFDEAIEKCVQDGINNILVLPGLLMSANHAKKDIPEKINEMSQKYPSLNFKYSRPLGLHPKILKVCAKRIESAEKFSTGNISRAETLLMTVGRGSSDPDANSIVANVSQILCDRMKFGKSETSYIGASQPLFTESLETSINTGFKRIIIFPYFLFTGVLVNKIFSLVDDIQKKHNEIEFLKAQYLNYDDLIIDIFREQAREVSFH